jgi:hypothetical protein
MAEIAERQKDLQGSGVDRHSHAQRASPRASPRA